MINFLYADFLMLFVVISYIAIVAEIVKWVEDQF
jgi:hypothetical protein